MGIRVDYKDVLNKLSDVQTKAQAAILMYAQQGAKKMENYAKTNRPWTDRTGHARQRLVGWVETLSTKVRIHIGHGVSYGVYLELAHEKRYAILNRTVQATSDEILKGYSKLLRYLK